MQTLLFYALKATVYSAVFFSYYCLALRNKRFHYYNRFYLLLTVMLSLLLPFVHLQLWQWNSGNTGVIQLLNVTGVNESEVVFAQNSSSFSLPVMATTLYCVIALSLLLLLAFSVAAIFRFKRKYGVEKIENINFINTDLQQSPFSFFNNLFWKNTLSLNDEAGKQMFTHELTHIEQNHSLDKLMMRIVTALFWFNPLYWLAQKELSLIHEFIADEKAVENKSAEAFALMILQSQYAKSIFSPAQSFHYSPIKRRLLMLTTSKKPSFSYARRIFVLPLLAITVLLFAFKLKKDEQGNATINANAPFVLVVDAGHGGTESGAFGIDNINEKDINLSVAKTIERLAPEYGITVKLTRTEDVTVALQNRMSYIKSVQPNACISIHVNASAEQQTKRNEASVYIPRKEGNENYAQSRLLGSSLLQAVQQDFPVNSNLLQRNNKGIYMIDNNLYPAVIFQCGYINNEQDVKQLTDNAKKEELARDILKGVVAYANADKNSSLQNTGNANNEDLQSFSDTAIKPVPLYIVDGKETSSADFDNLDKNKIESIDVLKGVSATKKYGDKGKNGVVIIKLKSNAEINPQKQKGSGNTNDNALVITTDKADSLLVILDGKTTITVKELYLMDKDKIAKINVLKGKSAIAKYGEKGSNGVIEITSKNEGKEKPAFFVPPVIVKDTVMNGIKTKDNNLTPNGYKNENYEAAFIQTQEPPHFPGGKEAWLQYLKRNARLDTPTKNGAPAGTYTVVVSFLVAKDGGISEVKADNDPGYGTAAEAVRLIQRGPYWVPAVQNGTAVIYRVKQAITFQVENN